MRASERTTPIALAPALSRKREREHGALQHKRKKERIGSGAFLEPDAHASNPLHLARVAAVRTREVGAAAEAA